MFSRPYPLTARDVASFDQSTRKGGTAGCVLANRLSTNPQIKVLLLERGDARTGWAARVPLMSTNFMGDESAAYQWPAARPVGDARTLSLVTGKGLGGGSSINSMQYTRGAPAEYDLWSKNGRRGWSYAEVEPYFKSCAEACTALGLPFYKDINDPGAPLTVCAKLDCTMDAASRRSSTFTAFLPQKLVEERKSHLHICTGAAVTAIDLEVDANGQQLVRGVTFEANEPGSKVVLCAGAIATPQILLLSGIGPKDKVKQPLNKELRGVGQNLQDHTAMGIMYSVPTDHSLHIIKTSRLRAIIELFRYIAFGQGLFLRVSPVTQLSILVDSALIDDSGHIISRKDTEPANLPDLELMPIHFNYSDPPIPIDAGTVRTTYHYGCTCRMAPESDAGVVDDKLRVHGIENLRIADCSVIPEMMSTHLQAPAVMIAERCADMINLKYSASSK
ncbi:alcohol oxidase [Mycena latifolia]|nr:alcohol oxidase [Mycena latifolia]